MISCSNVNNKKEYGCVIFSHDDEGNKIPISSFIITNDDLADVLLYDRPNSILVRLSAIAKTCELSPDLFVWVDGIIFKIKRTNKKERELISSILSSS